MRKSSNEFSGGKGGRPLFQMNRTLTLRQTSLAIVLICAALLGYGYYLQYVQGLEPCPLCLVQRLFFYAVLALFTVAALQGPGRIGASIYAGLVILFAAGG